MLRDVYRRFVTNLQRDEEQRLGRRAFLHMLMFCSAAFAAMSLPLAAISRYGRALAAPRLHPGVLDPVEPTAVALGPSNGLLPGSALTFNYPARTDAAIVVRLPDGSLRAYSRKCTHLQCHVYHDGASGRLLCPCHNGAFDAATGAPLYGPPRRPLPALRVVERDGQIWAMGVQHDGA